MDYWEDGIRSGQDQDIWPFLEIRANPGNLKPQEERVQ